MTRDGMPRAYLRIDPNIDHTHPDNLEGFIRLMCSAARQPERGRFHSRSVLEGLLGRAKVRALYDRRDVSDLDDGRVYVVGWDQWQEGDHTVGERMKRMRARRNKRDDAVTPPASLDRNDVTTDAVLSSSTSLGDGDDGFTPPPSAMGRRKDGTNPRASGTNPRAQGTSPRQEREKQKRGPSALHQILTAIQSGNEP